MQASIIFALGILSSLSAASQGIFTNPPLIRHAQLLSVNAGWALVGDHVLESNNLGQRWDDITPKQAKRIDGAFFLDRSTGWAVIVPGSGDGSSLSIAKTADRGATWSAWPFRGEDPKYFLEIYGGLSSITFIDARMAGCCSRALRVRPPVLAISSQPMMAANRGYSYPTRRSQGLCDSSLQLLAGCKAVQATSTFI